MAANPWDNDPIVAPQQASPFGSRPVIQQMPSPQDQAQLTRTNQEIANNPLQQESTRTNIQQNRQSMENQRFNQNQGLRQEFNNLPEVKNYSVALNSLNSALKAPDTPQGDLSVIYAYAKAADPGSVVREGEMDMATNTASLPQKLQVYAQAVTQGKRLPPEVRTGLIETMRQSVGGMRGLYDQQRARYAELAQQNGFDPQQIIGSPLYDSVRPAEEAYITAHGGTPRDPYAPDNQQPIQDQSFLPHLKPDEQIQFKDDAETRTRAKRFQDELYSALSSKSLKSKNDVDAFVQQFNQQNGSSFSIDWANPDTRKAIGAALSGKKFGVQTPADPAVEAAVRDRQSTGTGADAAFNVGAKDAITAGFAPRIAALGDALQRTNGSFSDAYNVSLDANRQYMNDLAGDHPIATGAGEFAGGLLLPGFGARTPAQLGALGAAYGGVYGANQGDSTTSFTDRGTNALVGASAGGVTGFAIPKGLSMLPRRGAGEVPPLVDPKTLELNEPMDAMRPAQRYQALKDAGFDNPPMAAVGGRTARVIDQGLTNLPPSAGVMEDAASPIARDARNAADATAAKFGSAKSQNDIGTAAQTGLSEWIARMKGDRSNPMDRGVIGKAYDAIPIAPQSPAVTTNTTTLLRDMTGRFQSNADMAELVNNPTFGKYLNAIEKNGLSWQDMKDFRSMVGEKIGERMFGESDSVGDYRALYAALSDDMRQTAAARGPRALQTFERANNLNAVVENRIQKAFVKILGPDAAKNPEAAAQALQKMTSSKGGDLRTLSQVYSSMKNSGQWNEVAAGMIRLGGLPAGGEGRAWNPETFVKWYAGMSEPARVMVFGNGELRKALDGFVAVNQQLARVNGLTNTSKTTTTFLGARAVEGVAGGATALLAFTHPLLAAGAAAAGAAGAGINYGLAKLWTNPGFIRLMTGYSRAVASGNANAVRSQVGRLSKLAATNPEIREPVEALLKAIANDNVVPSVAASSNPNGNSNNQQ